MVVLFHARLLLFPSGWSRSPATPNSSRTAASGSICSLLSGLVLAHVYGEAFARTPRTIGYGRFTLAAAHPGVSPSTW